MIKKEKSLLKYIFLVGLSDKIKEDILENFNESFPSNDLPKVLSYYYSEGINSIFNSIKENLETNLDLLNNIFPMKTDYLEIIMNDDYDEKKVRKLKNVFIDYIIKIYDDKKVPEHIYHCFQYEIDKGTLHDLILNFGVLIFYEKINIAAQNEKQEIKKQIKNNIYSAKALILISDKPIFSLMRQILEKIYTDFIKEKFTPFYLEPFIINSINTLTNNLPSIKFQNGISINYNFFQDQIMPFCDLNIAYFFEILDINDIYLIAEYYFLTKSIIICSPDIEILYPIYHILMTLFFPLNFHLRSYFYKLVYPELVVEGLCSILPCFYFIYTDINNNNNGFINENILKKIAKEKEDVLIYQIRKNPNKEKNKQKFEIKKNIYLFNNEKFCEMSTESKKGKTLIENIIGNNYIYKSIINSEYKRIKKLIENKDSDYFDIQIDLKEYDLLRKNFLGMIIKFLVIKIKPLTFKLNDDDKMEICPLIIEKGNKEKNEIDEQLKDFLDSPQTEIIYKNSTIKFNYLDVDYLKTQMLLDNFIKISKSDPNTLYFDEDNINGNNDKNGKNNNLKDIEFEELFNYQKFIRLGLGEIKKGDEISTCNSIIDFNELNKYITFDKEKIEKSFGKQIKFILYFNQNFILKFEKFNKALEEEKNINNDKSILLNINDIISMNNKENLMFYYLILNEAQIFRKLFYTINTKNKEELSACYIGLYISLYILNLLTLLTKESEEDINNVIIININTLFEKLFTLFTKTKCFYGKYHFITTLIYLILSSYIPLKLEYKERFIYSLQELKDVPSIIIFLLYNKGIEFNLYQKNNDNKVFKEKKIVYLKKKKHEHKFELEKLSSNFVCVDNNCQEYMWFDLVNSDKDEKICENALNPICKIEDILEKIKEKNSLIFNDIDNWDYIYQVVILDEIYFNLRFFRDDYLDEIEY